MQRLLGRIDAPVPAQFGLGVAVSDPVTTAVVEASSNQETANAESATTESKMEGATR
jgi:hypothetical protein